MLTLAAIEAEIEAIRVHARLFHSVDGILYRNGRTATAAEAAELRAGIARFEWLVREARRPPADADE